MSRILASAKKRRPQRREGWQVSPLGLNLEERLALINVKRLRTDRLARLRNQMQKHDVAGVLLSDPMNIRYATDARNMAIWTMHGPGRYLFVATDGPVILFEFGGTFHLNDELDTVDEWRKSVSCFYFMAGPRLKEKTHRWAEDIIGLMSEYGRSNRRLAVDRCEPWGAQLLLKAGIELVDAQEILELARSLKAPEEIQCMQLSIDVCDIAVARIRQAAEPGITENQLWSILHDTNISHGGEWVECRLLASGERTNPWYQESSDRVIQSGELIAFDTDMVGPFGYLADISRSFVCPGRKPTATQRMLYEIAQEQILTNVEIIKPGLSFREFSEICWPVPERFVPHRYSMMIHGAGLVDEYPTVFHAVDRDNWGYDGHFEANMVVCVESFIGEVGGAEGVKLEQQVHITENGAVVMSKAPLVDAIEA